MSQGRGSRSSAGANAAMGLILILLGGIILAGQSLGIELSTLLWPFFVFVPGAVLFALGVALPSASEVLMIIGSAVAATGVLLFYQNAVNHWESWAYAWTVVFPISTGFAEIVFGALRRKNDRVRLGLSLTGIGLAAFLIGLVFFELVLNISGRGFGRYTQYYLPVLLIALGFVWLLSSFIARPRPQADAEVLGSEPLPPEQTQAPMFEREPESEPEPEPEPEPEGQTSPEETELRM